MIHTALTDILLTGFDWTVPAHGGEDARSPASATPRTSPTSCVFLCSDLARFVTGQNIVVDGGMTLHGSGVDGLLDRFRAFLPEDQPPT